MAVYELTFYLNEEAELNKLKDLVTVSEGKITSEKNLGKKNLAFPIKKASVANLYQWIFEMDETKVNELKKKLNYNEKLIRYLLLVK
jgi:ribosomal protein S6